MNYIFVLTLFNFDGHGANSLDENRERDWRIFRWTASNHEDKHKKAIASMS